MSPVSGIVPEEVRWNFVPVMCMYFDLATSYCDDSGGAHQLEASVVNLATT